MRKIVITGATSFLAIPLIHLLLKNGDFIYAIIRPSSKNLARLPVSLNLKIIELDLKQYSELPNRVDDKIDVFYHMAWEGIRGFDRNDSIKQMINYSASIKAIETAIALGAHTYIGAGSQAEYGIKSGPVFENMIEVPDTEYGKYKLKSKQECETLAQKNNIKFIWPRIFSAYGEYDFPHSLLMTCIQKMLKNEPVLLTECSQQWNYINAKDVANALFLFGLSNCQPGVYNVASKNSRILKHYILEMKDILESSSKLIFGAIPYNSQGKVNLDPKIDKIKNELHWSEQISFRDGIIRLAKIMNEISINDV
jgi:UDP-glucose 4-epimerase